MIRNEIRTAMTSAIGAKESDGKKDLLKIALLLREANKISQKLKKNIVSKEVLMILISIKALGQLKWIAGLFVKMV